MSDKRATLKKAQFSDNCDSRLYPSLASSNPTFTVLPRMPLDTFIRENHEAIVAEWESFAKSLPMARTMSDVDLRDHCREMLQVVVTDMRTSQTEGERATKSTGDAPHGTGADTAATQHGTLRQHAGFDLVQLVAEFRALRASVLALWKRHRAAAVDAPVGASEIEEIMRFNEAIDQALAESVDSYSSAVKTSRDMFLAVLGHDLRSPLQAVRMTGQLLLSPNLSDKHRQDAGSRIQRASFAMGSLISDLLEFTRSQLGSSIPLEPTTCDVGSVCASALETTRTGNPEQGFEEEISGDLVMSGDAPRLQQALVNLLANAVHHGDRGKLVSLTAQAANEDIEVRVTNFGRPIPAAALQSIFKPLVRVPTAGEEIHELSKNSLGLGLFIVHEIVTGHGGSVSVQSSEEAGTAFTIRLPRAGIAISKGDKRALVNPPADGQT